MGSTQHNGWHAALLDPSGMRADKPRKIGKTMIIDKGLGITAFQDLLEAASEYIDIIKIGFGTSALYPVSILKKKIELTKRYNVCIKPGGTFFLKLQ